MLGNVFKIPLYSLQIIEVLFYFWLMHVGIIPTHESIMSLTNNAHAWDLQMQNFVVMPSLQGLILVTHHVF